MTNKSLFKQKYFSVITKNSNWEIQLRIQLRLKDTMGLWMKNYIFGVDNLTFRGVGGFTKNQYRGRVA